MLLTSARRVAWTAVAATVLLLLGACAGGGGGGTSGDATTPPSAGYDRPGDPRQVGTGTLVEMSLDGSAAYIQEEDPRFPQPGCEGQPEPVMFRLPLAGGEREVLGAGKEPLNGNLIRGKGRRVAVVSGCEEFFSDLLVGVESPDGRLSNLQEVTLQRGSEEAPPAPFSFAWSVDGTHLLAAVNEPDPAGPGKPEIVRIDPSTGRGTRLFEVPDSPGISQAGQLSDGTYVLAGDGQVTLRDDKGAIRATFPGNGFVVSPDGRRVASFGEALLLVQPGAKEPVTLVPAEKDRQITSAAFSPDGRAVAYISSGPSSDNILSIVTLAGAKVTKVAGPGPLGRAVFAGDGKALAFNEFSTDASQFVAKLFLVRFGS